MATTAEIAKYLPAAIDRVYGAVADCAGASIVAWRHPTEPQPTDLSALVDAYLAAQEADRPRREQIAQAEATARGVDSRLEALGLSPKAALYLVVRDLCEALPATKQTQATQRWVQQYDAAAVVARGR